MDDGAVVRRLFRARSRAEVGQLGEGQQQLRLDAPVADGARLEDEAWLEPLRIDELQKGDSRRSARDDDRGGQKLTAVETDTRRPSFFNVDPAHGRVGAQPRAVRRGARSERRHEDLHPSHRDPLRVPRLAVDAELVEEEVGGGARRARAERHATESGPGKARLQRLGLEPLVQEVGDGHGQRPEELVHRLRAQPAKIPPQLHEPEQVAYAFDVRHGGWLQREGLQESGERPHPFGEARPGFGVTRRETSDLLLRFRLVTPEGEGVTVASGSEDDRVRGVQLQAVGLERKRVGEGLRQKAQVGPHRGVEALRKLD